MPRGPEPEPEPGPGPAPRPAPSPAGAASKGMQIVSECCRRTELVNQMKYITERSINTFED